MTKDLHLRRDAIERAKAGLCPGSRHPDIDPVVLASWRRCAAHVADDLDTARVDKADLTRERWDASPVRRGVPGLAGQLDQLARSGDLIGAIADGDGRILWQSTPPWLRKGSERIGFQPGGVWHEAATGTNGIGLALAADVPTEVFANEHWLGPVHDWVCYAAPIHDVDGTQLGAIDLSTTWKHANPLALTTVASIASLAEHELRLNRSMTDLDAPALDMRVLGSPAATLDGVPLRLTQRQFEILTILAVSGGATLGELHAHIYGDRPVALATLKAEMSRLRRALGGRLTSRPYRLTLSSRVDALHLLERLDTGDVEGAARLYAGQLLPASEAPFVGEHRHHLDVALRTALLMHGTSAGVLRYNAVHPYDVEVLTRERGSAGDDDPLVPALTGRLAVATDS